MGIILLLLPFNSQRLGATPFLLGALIGHRMFVPWALVVAAIAAVGAALAGPAARHAAGARALSPQFTT
jgi:hypothetical protein